MRHGIPISSFFLEAEASADNFLHTPSPSPRRTLVQLQQLMQGTFLKERTVSTETKKRLGRPIVTEETSASARKTAKRKRVDTHSQPACSVPTWKIRPIKGLLVVVKQRTSSQGGWRLRRILTTLFSILCIIWVVKRSIYRLKRTFRYSKVKNIFICGRKTHP